MSNLKKCSECATMVPAENAVCHNCGFSFTKKVGWKLIIACIIAPGIFCWFLLRNGYSKKVRVIGATCGILGILLALETISGISSDNAIQDTALQPTESVSNDAKNEIAASLKAKMKEIGFKIEDAQLFSSDLNSDGSNDYFIQADTRKGTQAKGTEGKYQAILLSNGSKFDIAFERIEGLNSSHFVVRSVEAGIIEGTATLYSKDDPICCPSITQDAKITWNGSSFEQSWVDNSPFSSN